MPETLKGTMRNAIITGAAHGIGKSSAFKFAQRGYRVFLLDVSEDVEDVAGAINREYGDDIAGWQAVDLADSAAAKAGVTSGAHFFGGSLDVLVNNAGTIEAENGRYPRITEITDDLLVRQFANNVFSMFYVTRAAVPYLRKGCAPSIINISSLAVIGLLTNSHYSASKGAVDSLTRSLAIELAPDVAVMGIAPGLTDTDIIADISPQQRSAMEKTTLLGQILSPWEISNQIVHLAHPDSRAFSGQILHVNNGSIRQVTNQVIRVPPDLRQTVPAE